MLYELALISVVIASGYWGWYFVRNPPNGTPLFGLMQLAAAIMAALGLLGRVLDVDALGITGAIGLGAGLCMLVVGPLVRAAARRFAASERIGIATRLLDIADILAPGSGVADEKALLAAMREIRAGKVEQTVDALVAAKHRAPDEAKIAIDERIAMLYLAAYRWRDAIAHAEAHLMPSTEPELRDETRATTSVSLRDALGIAPPVWVELLGAYARTGDLDRAGRMMARLEEACAGREDAGIWLHRARMMFLAMAGRPEAVRTLVERRRARHMSRAARTYWVAVAHEHRGDREAASAAYERARGKSRGRPRELIDEALTRLADAKPVTLSPETADLVSKIEAAPLPPPIKIARLRGPWATWGLTGVLLGVALAITTFVGPSNDLGVLVRAGAMVRSRIDDGEWWRLVSCIFVHVGSVHLVINAIGLFFLGRIAEELFGTARTCAIFAIAGLAGSVASYLGSPAGISAGASGAVFGVLGAVFMELTLHRERYRTAWKRGMWGGLAVVTVAQIAIGFFYPIIDQWAHGAGLVAGMLFGALLSPAVGWARLGRIAGRAIALAFAALALVVLVLVVRTSLADSLMREPREPRVVDNIVVVAPASWLELPHGLSDPDDIISLSLATTSVTDPANKIEDGVARLLELARERGFESLQRAPELLVPLPHGWQGSEHVATIRDAAGYEHRYRFIACGRVFDETLVLVVVYAPDTIAREVPAFVAELIGSITPA